MEDFDEKLMKRGSVYGHFPWSTLASEAVWSRFFRKELPTDRPKIPKFVRKMFGN